MARDYSSECRAIGIFFLPERIELTMTRDYPVRLFPRGFRCVNRI